MTTREKYNNQIEAIKASEAFDDLAKKTMVEALEMKRDSAIRAEEAKISRAREKLFIAHYAEGCPKCGETYRPSDDEINSYLSLREASAVKL